MQMVGRQTYIRTWYTDKGVDRRQVVRQPNGKTGGQTEGQAVKQTNRQAEGQTVGKN